MASKWRARRIIKLCPSPPADSGVGASFRWRQVKVWGETVNREMRAWSEGMKRNPPNTTFRVLRPHKVTASAPPPLPPFLLALRLLHSRVGLSLTARCRRTPWLRPRGCLADGGDARGGQASDGAGESTRPSAVSPWSQLASECRRFRHPPPPNNWPSRVLALQRAVDEVKERRCRTPPPSPHLRL
eukprot:SAG25_NODE_852_length_5073_cov_31.793727_2_plen_186_part_00